MSELSSLQRLEKRVDRERRARKQAEKLLTERSFELYNALQASQESQNKLEMALWASQESYWEWHAQSDMFHIRAFALKNKEELSWDINAIDFLARIHPSDLASLQFNWSMTVLNGRDSIEISFRFKFGQRYQWMRMRGRVMERNPEGTALYIIGTTKDITRQRDAEQSFHLMASAFASSREPMLVLNHHHIINECNAAFVKLMSLDNKEQCLGLSLTKFLPKFAEQTRQLEESGQVIFESEIHNHAGKVVPVDVSVGLFSTRSNISSYIIATLRDISEHQKNEMRLRKMALYDDLTGLQNRTALREELAKMIKTGSAFNVIFVDLDGFKQINDTAGHDQGDECLKKISRQLQDKFVNSSIARWGGDEFVVLVPHADTQLCLTQCERLIKDIEADLIKTQSTELLLSASIGIARFPEHGETVEALLQNADVAMYHAKTSGKGQVLIYQQGLLESMQQKVTMLSDLRRAIANYTLDFYLQGKYSSQGRLTGAEVLCRWSSPLHGTVSPAVFIPLAESNHLDSQIGFQALESACDYVAIFESFNIYIPIAINISPNQILDNNFAQRALSVCQEKRVSPSMIEIEMTESIFMRDQVSAVRSLNALRESGFVLALDDFGSGFSSLSYLRSFSFEVVKVDRSLVQGISTDNKALSLLQGIVAMLKSLDLHIVIEGVEDAECLAILAEMQVDAIQGFYFDKPMPFESFAAKHCETELLS